MRAAKGRAKAWLMEVTSRVRRRSRRPEQKQRKPPRPKAAPCCIYPLPKDACEVIKAAAAAIAGQMSQRQASREHAVSRSDVQRAVDRHRYTTARSTDLSLRSNLALMSAIFIFCLCSVGDTLQPKRRGPKPLVDESALVEWLERERQQGRPPTRDNIISAASRMYNDSVRTDDRPSTTLTLKSMDKWWRLFLRCHPEVSGRLALES